MTPELVSALSQAAIVIATLMTSVWVISLLLKDASIVDIVWGSGFVLVAWVAFFSADSRGSIGWLVPLLTTIWGVRLSVYLGWRNIGKTEDYRYQAMRKRWGKSFPFASFFTVFMVQGIVMWIVSLPVYTALVSTTDGFRWLTICGVIVWAIGLGFEAIGDWQLARFKADPANKGKVLDRGLWRFTRHPNYFGDFVVWWGLYFVSASQSGQWWTAIGPIVMSVFLMRVSGVTLLEKNLKKTKPDYSKYVARTNSFFPGPPKSDSVKR